MQNKGGVDVSTLTTDSTNIGNYRNNKWSITNDKAQYSTDGTWNNGSYTKGEEGEVLLTTGASDSFAKMNIYDVAGNVFEWTLECKLQEVSSKGVKLASLINTQISPIRMAVTTASGPCVGRGGYYYDGGTGFPASSRDCYKVVYANDDFGFRVTIY